MYTPRKYHHYLPAQAIEAQSDKGIQISLICQNGQTEEHWFPKKQAAFLEQEDRLYFQCPSWLYTRRGPELGNIQEAHLEAWGNYIYPGEKDLIKWTKNN